jgi:hypothetical protein
LIAGSVPKDRGRHSVTCPCIFGPRNTWENANDTARFRAYAADLVGLGPEVLVATTTPILQALQQRTQTIPIVSLDASLPQRK